MGGWVGLLRDMLKYTEIPASVGNTKERTAVERPKRRRKIMLKVT
jgi:hypothetical protein